MLSKRIAKRIGLVGACLAFALGLLFGPYLLGVAKASLLARSGRPTFVVYGLPSPSLMEAADTFPRRYGVHFDLSGCMVPPGGEMFERGHNSATAAVLRAKYPDEVPEELRRWLGR